MATAASRILWFSCREIDYRGHAATGKKAIFVNPQFTLFITGMDESESRDLLERLFRVTAVLEHQYRHHGALFDRYFVP